MLDVVIYLCNWIIRHTFRRQQGKRANLKTGVTRKQSVPIIPKSEHSYPLIHTCTCAYQWVRNVRFVSETPVLGFAFLPYYRQFSHRQ